MTRAGAWSVPFLGLVLLSAWVVAGVAQARWVDWAVRNQVGGLSGVPHSAPPYLLWLLVVGGACWAVCTVAEVLLARTLAGDYPPLGPFTWTSGSALPRTLRQAAGSLDRKLGNVGGGCLAVAALAAAGPMIVLVWSFVTGAAVALWVLAALGATTGHLLATRSRLRGRRAGRVGGPVAGS